MGQSEMVLPRHERGLEASVKDATNAHQSLARAATIGRRPDMRPSKPPALATWMLEHFALGRDREVLAGDLLEEFQRRRSVAWYWRQVLWAIVVGLSKRLRAEWAEIGFALVWTWVVFTVGGLLPRSMVIWAFSHRWPESRIYLIGVIFATSAILLSLGLGLYLQMMRSFDLQGFARGVLVVVLGSALHSASLPLVRVRSRNVAVVLLIRGVPVFFILLAAIWRARRRLNCSNSRLA